MTNTDELKKLSELLDAGAITEEEFCIEKKKILYGDNVKETIKRKTSALAIIAFTLSIITPLWPITLVMCLVALSQINKSNGFLMGRGLAIAGTVLSTVGTIIILIIGIPLIVGFFGFVKEASEAPTNVAKEVRGTVNDISAAAISIAENFQQAKITETFVESLPEVSDTGEGNLEVATMKNTKTFKRTDNRTILWDSVSLGTTTTEIKVPATYRYHIRLSDSWKLEVRDQNCIVIAPSLRATTPVAIHTDELEKRSDEGWARFNADRQMESLQKTITPRLNHYAQTQQHFDVVREHSRKTVAKFVREWLMKEDHWREDRFRSIHVIFADEAEAEDFPAKPTLELN